MNPTPFQRNIPLAGLEPRVYQTADGGLAQLVVNPHTGALRTESSPLQGAITTNGVSVVTTGVGNYLPLFTASSTRVGFSVQNTSPTEYLTVRLTEETVSVLIRVPPDMLYESPASLAFSGSAEVSGTANITVLSFTWEV